MKRLVLLTHMRINKIKKINVGSFKDYTCPPGLSEFSDINIILGWNGTGKTIVSKLFQSFEDGKIHFDNDEGNFNLSINNKVYTNKTILNCGNDIQVFNKSYIDNILRQDTLGYIFFLGKKEVDYSDKEKEKKELQEKLDKIVINNIPEELSGNIIENIKSIDGIDKIKTELGGGVYSNYGKTQFENRIKNFEGISSVEELVLDGDSLKDKKEELRNKAKEDENLEKLQSFYSFIKENIESLNNVFVKDPVQKISARIKGYGEYSKEANWIEEGVKLHFKDDKYRTECLFCNNLIKNKDELTKHFSRDVVEINNVLHSFKDKIGPEYIKFQDIQTITHEKVKSELLEIYEKLNAQIEKKIKNLETPLKPCEIRNIKFIPTDVKYINSLAWDIEKHYVSKNFSTYKKSKDEHDTKAKERNNLQKQIDSLHQEISKLTSETSNILSPAFKLTTIIKVAFPYKNIEVVDSDNGVGYVLMRDGKKCKLSSLSEGEKNLIALSYFILSLNTTLEDEKLDAKGVVVIDDPISSLDKGSIFQIFSLIANEMEDKKDHQYFILTHNLDFYGFLVEHFRNRIKKNDGGVNLYQIVLKESGSYIGKISKQLENFRSDYYYSMCLLFELQNNCTEEQQYLSVNLMRRCWETFLGFKYNHPTDSSGIRDLLKRIYKRYNNLRDESNPTEDLSSDYLSMYRFINYGSHKFSDVESSDKDVLEKAQENIEDFFKIIKKVDPDHYERVRKSV